MSRRPPGLRPQRGGAPGGTNTGRALALVLVAVVVAVLLLARLGSGTKPTASPTTTSTTATSSTTSTTIPTIPPSEIKLQVLNGLINGSISSEFSTKLRSAYGYDTLAPNDTTKVTDASSIWVVTSGKQYLNAAYVLATEVGLPKSAVQPEAPTATNSPIPASVLTQADLVLVVGRALSAKA